MRHYQFYISVALIAAGCASKPTLHNLAEAERKACQGKNLNDIFSFGGSALTTTYSEGDTGGVVPVGFLPTVNDEIPDECKQLLEVMIKACREKKEERVKEEWTVKLGYSVSKHGWSSESHQQLRRQRPKPVSSNYEAIW